MTEKLLLAATLRFCAYAADDLTRYVNPWIGTGAGAPDYNLGNSAGDTPPGVVAPFGMLFWSPDTTTLAGGYRYSHSSIQGFSLTHFSGRGISCYQDVPIMPLPGTVSISPGTHWQDYSAPFQHQNEQVSPGYYAVTFDNGVTTELTATTRTGFGRFTFPGGPFGTLAINAGGSANGNRDAGTGVELVGSNEITGRLSAGIAAAGSHTECISRCNSTGRWRISGLGTAILRVLMSLSRAVGGRACT